jgi:hypothetical protein
MVLSLMSKVDMTVTMMDVIDLTDRGRLTVVNDKKKTMNISTNCVMTQP